MYSFTQSCRLVAPLIINDARIRRKINDKRDADAGAIADIDIPPVIFDNLPDNRQS